VRKWLSPTCRFVNALSLNFLWKKETRQESSTSDFVVCMEMPAWGTSSVRRWVKRFKDGNTNIADQPRCGRPRTAATERHKQKVDELIRQDQRITFREIAAKLGVGHYAVQEIMDILGYRKVCSLWVHRLLTEEHKTAGNCSPIHPTFRIWALRLPVVRILQRSPERSLLWDWGGSSGNRAKLVARRWNGLLSKSHF
jgi:plasmid stabilization system protein ParE